MRHNKNTNFDYFLENDIGCQEKKNAGIPLDEDDELQIARERYIVGLIKTFARIEPKILISDFWASLEPKLQFVKKKPSWRRSDTFEGLLPISFRPVYYVNLAKYYIHATVEGDYICFPDEVVKEVNKLQNIEIELAVPGKNCLNYYNLFRSNQKIQHFKYKDITCCPFAGGPLTITIGNTLNVVSEIVNWSNNASILHEPHPSFDIRISFIGCYYSLMKDYTKIADAFTRPDLVRKIRKQCKDAKETVKDNIYAFYKDTQLFPKFVSSDMMRKCTYQWWIGNGCVDDNGFDFWDNATQVRNAELTIKTYELMKRILKNVDFDDYKKIIKKKQDEIDKLMEYSKREMAKQKADNLKDVCKTKSITSEIEVAGNKYVIDKSVIANFYKEFGQHA